MAYHKSTLGSCIGYIAGAIGTIVCTVYERILVAFEAIAYPLTAVFSSFAFKGDTDTHLAFEHASRLDVARSSADHPFAAFISRAKSHQRFIGSGFVDPGNAYA